MDDKEREEQLRKDLEIEELYGPSDGVYAIPRPKGAPRYDVVALVKHCKELGVEPMELSREEKKKFEVD